jgi:DNA-binding LytR/AlgR family response regulator
MNVIIIEDEKPAARRLSRMLEDLDVKATKMLHSVEESIEWFQNNEHPSLIFLDIQLSDGLSFEIFEHVTITSAIIFTTAYDEYALKAFKLNSIDYLLKPIDEDELKAAVDKYKSQHIVRKEVQLNFDDIKKLLVNPIDRKFKKRFTIKVGQHLKIISTENIECFFSENKATYLHADSNRSYIVDGALEQIQTELDPEKFFRVNRTFIVQISAIKDIISYTNSRLKIILKYYN